MKNMLLLLSLFTCWNSFADVWVSERSWKQSDIGDFSDWVKSKSFNTKIFSYENSEFNGIKTDCADAIVAARVIYSYRKKLNFKIKIGHNSFLTNESNLFDNIQDPSTKVKKFIEHIGASIGTETLARLNSYPIAPKDIRASDFYVSRWKTNGNFVRHAYMIKDILETGHMVLYSSTTPVKVRELEVREGAPKHILSGRPWGFKRFIPFEISNEIPSDSSLEQYRFLSEFGEDYFFPRVIDELKVREDTLDENFKRRIKNLCSQLKLRQREINSTQVYLSKINRRCMNSSEYDEHSTPSRDKSLLNGIKNLLYGWKRIRKTEYISEISTEVTSALDYIFRKNDSELARENLNKLCSIKLNLNNKLYTFNLKNFFDLKQKNRLSFHPNDTKELRWGLIGKKTHCSSY